MNTELVNKLVARWNAPNGRPLSGKLFDGSKSPDQPDCMCVQGWTLYESGMSLDELAQIDQSEADIETAKRLDRSLTHAVLLRQINDGYELSPSVVLTNPAAILGDQADRLLAFWHHLDAMTVTQWGVAKVATTDALALDERRAAISASGETARHTARDAASYASSNAGWATNEIQGAAIMRKRGQAFFFLPLFGFSKPEEIPL
jgi:hypothetical protein